MFYLHRAPFMIVCDGPLIQMTQVHSVWVFYGEPGCYRGGGGHSTFFLVGMCHTGFQKYRV